MSEPNLTIDDVADIRAAAYYAEADSGLRMAERLHDIADRMEEWIRRNDADADG